MKRIVIFILAFFLFLTVSPSVSQATAGGHSGGRSVHSSSRSGGGLHSYSGSRGGTLGTYTPHYYGGTRSPLGSLVSGLFFVGVAGFSIFRKKIRVHQSNVAARQDFLAAIPGNNQKKQHLLQEVETAFLTIQNAWNQSSLEAAKKFYTEKLYQTHLAILNEQRENGFANRTEKTQLQELSNYRLINPHSFSIQIYFTCLDYEEELATGRILAGSTSQKQAFLQTWYFDYDDSDQCWKADYIQPITLS
ncbi:MAG: TIM44-like domain-containing protein [Enterococcus sp.]